MGGVQYSQASFLHCKCPQIPCEGNLQEFCSPFLMFGGYVVYLGESVEKRMVDFIFRQSNIFLLPNRWVKKSQKWVIKALQPRLALTEFVFEATHAGHIRSQSYG